ncbi:ERCC4 domain containing protein [Nitzschia inconspicua]|uniref:Crossover junction endonuclease MUS81 n=1 Tax=Nitzschia inconspicua TaxID=303405 RepID=A0A9K3Q616_9STRA|nr:ERCC4 domain containing protein [Nitzschia inconspicua]
MPGSRKFVQPVSGTSVTVTIKPVKAACPENQDALDRLQEMLIKAQANLNSNFVHTLRRGMVSVRECRHPILTQKEACALKNIGPTLAKVIVPPTTNPQGKSSNTNTNSKAPPKAIVAPMARPLRSLQQDSSSTAITKIDENKTTIQPSSAAVPTAKEKAYYKAKQEAETLILPSNGPWKLILLIDGREHNSKQVVSQCKQSGIPCEERHLPIGDMAWIAQCVQPKTNGMSSSSSSSSSENNPIEIMVGTIIERKEVADLACSLYGTRYSEQRLRLSQCGLPQVLFLVEGDTSQVVNCPAETLQMAMMETRIQLGFQIVQTKNLSETVRVLKGLHRRIVQRTFPEAFDKNVGIAVPSFANDPGEIGPRSTNNSGRRRNRRPSSLLEMVFDTKPQPPFGASRFITYDEIKAKVLMDREQGTKSVQAITMAMLKQIPSLSQKKCTAIAEQYPTMNRLIEALCYHDGDPQSLLSGISMGRQTVGPKSAAEVFAACCMLGDGSVVASHGPAKQTAKKATHKEDTAITNVKIFPSTNTTTMQGNRINAATSKTQLCTHNSASDDSFSVAPVGVFPSVKVPAPDVHQDSSTPEMKRKFNCNDPMSDMFGRSASATAPVAAAVASKRAKTTSSSKGRKNSSPAGLMLDESFLFSSPDDSVSTAAIRPAKKLVQPHTNGTAKPLSGGAKSGPPVIEILDSDIDDSSLVVTNETTDPQNFIDHHSQDVQHAILASILDTPSTMSSFGTPCKPNAAERAARKVSNDSSNEERSLSSGDYVSSNSIISSKRSTPKDTSSLRERLAKRMDKEVIEIDL